MPAIMDDPASPTIYRVSGAAPFPEPGNPGFPTSIAPRQVTLRDRQTIATIVPFASSSQVPASLLKYLSDQFAKEIEGGDTYPMIEPMPLEKYSAYWFQNFAAIMLLGNVDSADQVVEGKDWSKQCLGSFYIKPNYPGRSSHVCNAGFLVTDAARNRGVGRLMGETYLDWAPKLGYTYSVFNLVYDTNVASCKIWDALGFKRIGRVKGCGNLKSYPDRLVDAIIYGRDLGEAAGDGADGPVSEERFDKIKFYLKYGQYPNGSDRAEKSRLRSAATHYKLLENDVLMLKDKEVISDPLRQMDIAKRVHESGSHAGINKTTATIAERYHWSRIKETVSDIIRLCAECKELGKVPLPNSAGARRTVVNNPLESDFHPGDVALSTVADPIPAPEGVDTSDRILSLQHHHEELSSLSSGTTPYGHPSDIASLLNPVHPLRQPDRSGTQTHNPMLQDQSHGQIPQAHHQMHHPSSPLSALHEEAATIYSPIDPQIISQPGHQLNHHPFNSFHAHNIPHHHGPHSSHASLPGHETFSPHMHAHHPSPEDAHSFQALLHGDPDELDQSSVGHHDSGLQGHDEQQEHDQAAMDRDLDMLIEHHDSEMEDDTALDGGNGAPELDAGSEKRARQSTASEDDRSSKRRNWDHVVFDIP
ncbi:hypothetical protein BJ170DRAFT_380044 [Xylariales sp. AK1849]|nr:hypothetical protein BJ170DRAFT_380044 [Xylariales sp. AK1849]